MGHPIVIIPGLGGSLLVNKKQPIKRVFHRDIIDNRWLNIHPYSPSYMIKWKDEMRCEFEYGEGGQIIGYKNYDKNIQPYDIFGIKGIQNMVGDFDLLNKTHQDVFENMFHYKYFYELNQRLLKKGYLPRSNLIGFPWDFRLILDPVLRHHTFDMLRFKIESVVKYHEERVVIVSHSLGGVLTKWFLEEQGAEWSEKYIRHLVMSNTPFGGSPSAIKALLIGEYYVPFFNKFFVDELRVNSGIVMGLPNLISYNHKDVFWKTDNDEIITLHDFHKDKPNNIGFKLWHDMYSPYLYGSIQKKNSVPVTLINSSGIETPNTYISKSLHEMPYKVLNDDGDSIIPTRSLLVGKELFPKHKYIELKKVSHSEIISHPVFLDYIIDTWADS